MGKKVDDSVLDAAWDKVATSTRQVVCSAEPANFADVANVDLAETVVDGTDFTNADGDTSGRKVTVGQQADAAIHTTGDATHIAYHDGVTLLYVTTCTLQGLTSGGTVTVPAHDFEIADPA